MSAVDHAMEVWATHQVATTSSAKNGRTTNSRCCTCGHPLPWTDWEEDWDRHRLSVLADAGLLRAEVTA